MLGKQQPHGSGRRSRLSAASCVSSTYDAQEPGEGQKKSTLPRGSTKAAGDAGGRSHPRVVDGAIPELSTELVRLCRGAAGGNQERVEKMLEANPHAAQGIDELHWTLLMHAANENQFGICKKLISLKADPDAATPSGLTALHLISRSTKAAAIARMLLSEKAR